MSIVIFAGVGILCPFVIWIGIHMAMQQDIFTPRSIFRVIRVSRWISYTSAILLWACWLLLQLKWLWLYALSISEFSIGLSFPEHWLKRRLNSSDLTITPKHQV